MEGLVFFRDAFDLLDQDFVLNENIPQRGMIVNALHKRGRLHSFKIIGANFGVVVGIKKKFSDGGFFLFVEKSGKLVTDIDFFVDLFLDFSQPQVSLTGMFVGGGTGQHN